MTGVTGAVMTESPPIPSPLPQIHGPAGGWKAWRHKIRRLRDGDVDEEWAALFPDIKVQDEGGLRKQVRNA